MVSHYFSDIGLYFLVVVFFSCNSGSNFTGQGKTKGLSQPKKTNETVEIQTSEENSPKINTTDEESIQVQTENSSLPLPTTTPCSPVSIIDFEKLPDGSQPYEGLEISDQYWNSHGVKFSLEGGGYPVIGQKGSPCQGFYCQVNCGPTTLDDTAAPGEKLGEFFLTYGDNRTSTLIISYFKPQAAASAAIYDIDGNEAWTVTILDSGGNVLNTETLGPYGGREKDGKATYWKFSRPSADISTITVSPNIPVGLGFDWFSPSAVCVDD